MAHALLHYDELLPKAASHAAFSRALPSLFARDAALLFSPASALFYASVLSHKAMRRVVPWALSVWSL